MHRVFLLFIPALAGISTFCNVAYAKQDEYQWSFSPILGIHAPNLKVLNEGVFRAPLKYEADILTADTPTRIIGQVFSNPLPGINYAPLAGIEFQWKPDKKNALLIGGSTWEGSSASTVNGRFPVQGFEANVTNDRRATLSYNEFFLGWKHTAISQPDKYNLYFRLSLHEIFDIGYREDWVFLYLDGPAATFKKIFVIESKATGILMLQPGVGGEVFLKKWLSLGFETSYSYGLRKFTFRNNNINRDFLPTDGIFMNTPVRPNPSESGVSDPEDGNLEYQAADGSGYKKLRLSFDGWKALFKINIYY
ncbi:MAG: hypothetical protein M3A44_14065 [Gammaproteobacteria bacterium]